MNWRKIGNDFVNKLVECAFEPHGWRCEKAGAAIFWIPKRNPVTKQTIYSSDGKPVLMPMQKREDLFGAFDLACVSPEWPVTYWVQSTVGGSQAISERRKKVEAVAGQFHPAAHRLMLWSRHQVNKQLVRVELLDQRAGKWEDMTALNFRAPIFEQREAVEFAAKWSPAGNQTPAGIV